jgi:hypothetical protein
MLLLQSAAPTTEVFILTLTHTFIQPVNFTLTLTPTLMQPVLTNE